MKSDKNYYLPSFHANNPEYHEIIVERALGRNSWKDYRRLNNLKTFRAGKEFLKMGLVGIVAIDLPLCILFIIKTLLNNPLPFAELLAKLSDLFFVGLVGIAVISGLIIIFRCIIWEIQDLCVIISVRRAGKRDQLY